MRLDEIPEASKLYSGYFHYYLRLTKEVTAPINEREHWKKGIARIIRQLNKLGIYVPKERFD